MRTPPVIHLRWPILLPAVAMLGIAGCLCSLDSMQRAMAKHMGAFTDETKEMAAKATQLSPGEVMPSWNSPIDTMDIDDMVAVPGAGILVGLTSLGAYGEPSYGPYELLDKTNGQVKWTYGRSSDPERTFEVLATSPVILAVERPTGHEDSRYFAIDPSNGNGLWDLSLSPTSTVDVSADGKTLLVGRVDGDAFGISAVDLRSGNRLWEARQSLQENEPAPVLVPFDDVVWAVGSRIAGYGMKDGKRRFSVMAPAPASAGSVLALGRDVAVGCRDGSVLLVGASGRVKWRGTIGAAPTTLGSGKDQLFVYSATRGRPGGTIFALSRANGRAAWSRTVGDQLDSGLVGTEGKLVFTLGGLHLDKLSFSNLPSHELHVWDARTGATVAKKKCVLAGGLPDRLYPFPGRVVVVGEHGASAYALGDAHVLWSHGLRPPSAYGDVLHDLRDALEEAGKGKGDHGAAAQAALAQTMALGEMDRSQALVQSAIASEQSVLQSTSTTLSSSSNASASARMSAHLDRIAAIDEAMATTRSQQAYQRSMAAANFASSIDALSQAIQEVIRRAPLIAAAHRGPIRLEIARRQLARSVQQGKLVRALGYWYWGFAVIDLKTGRWTEVATSPDSDAYDETGNFGTLAAQLPTLSADGKTLAVKGLGLDPKSWRQIETTWNRIVLPSVLIYDVDKLEMHGAKEDVSFGAEGFIDTHGRFVVPPRFEKAYGYANGVAVGSRGGRIVTVGRKGMQPTLAKYDWVGLASEGLVAARRGHKFGVLDMSGQVVVPFKWDWIAAYRGGLARVQKASAEDPEKMKNGFIDRTGRVVVPPIYDDAVDFHDGRAAVERGKMWGYVDKTGNVVIPLRYHDAHPFSEGVALVSLHDRLLVIDGTGRTLFVADERSGWVPTDTMFHDGVADTGNELLHRDGRHVDGKWAKMSKVFRDGLVAVCAGPLLSCYGEQPIWGFADKDGRYVIQAQFEKTGDFSHGLAAVRVHGLWGYIDKTGKMVIPPQFAGAEEFNDEGVAIVRVAGKRWFATK